MVTLLPTPIGNLEDITLRTLRRIEQTELFLAEDTRQTKRLFLLLQERGLLGKLDNPAFLSFHEHNAKERLEAIGKELATQEVSYLTDAGMPGISDPGQALVAYCQEHGIAYEVYPGASALTVAYSAGGFGRGKFCFEAFLPHKKQERVKRLQALLKKEVDVILYEAPHRLLQLLEEIVAVDKSRKLFLAKEISKKHQRYYKGSAQTLLKQLDNESIKGEWVVVIEASKAPMDADEIMQKIAQLDLSLKQKAKILAQIVGGGTKEWYEKLSSYQATFG